MTWTRDARAWGIIVLEDTRIQQGRLLGGIQVDASRNPFGPHRGFFRTLQIRDSARVETKCPLWSGK